VRLPGDWRMFVRVVQPEITAADQLRLDIASSTREFIIIIKSFASTTVV
jgi:hypothetical protein